MCRAGTCYTCRPCCCCCLFFECFRDGETIFDTKTREEQVDEDSEETPEPSTIKEAFCGSYGPPLVIYSIVPCTTMPFAIIFFTMYLYYVSNQEVICESAHEQDFWRNLILSGSYYLLMIIVFGLLFCCDRRHWLNFNAMLVATIVGFCLVSYALVRLYDGNLEMYLMTPNETTTLFHCSASYWYGLDGYTISLLPYNESDYWTSPIANLSCRWVLNDFGYCPEMRRLLNSSALLWRGDIAFYELCSIPYDQAYPICSDRPLRALIGDLVGHVCSVTAIISYFAYLWWISCRQYYKYCCECFMCCKFCRPFCREYRCCPRDGEYHSPPSTAPQAYEVVRLADKIPFRPFGRNWRR